MTAEQERFLTDEQLKSSDSEFKNMQKAWYEKTYGVQTQEATTEANKRIAELEANNHDLHEALKLFKKEAESYGEAWARCYVADFDRIAADSKKVRFDLLAIQQDRLKSFADALLSATPAESLQAHEILIEAAKVAVNDLRELAGDCNCNDNCAEVIRALKEVK